MSRSTRIIATLMLALLALALGVSALSAGSSAVEANAPVSVSVSGRVFFDLNVDGDFDAGEPPVEDAVVELRYANGGGALDHADYDAGLEGMFTFTDVVSGNYQVFVISLPDPDAIFTSPNPVSVRDRGRHVVEDVNFGIVLPRTVTGRVYTDSNPNGAYDLRLTKFWPTPR